MIIPLISDDTWKLALEEKPIWNPPTNRAVIVAPHPDHEACGRAAKEVARRTGASLSLYFFWTWHRGGPETLRGVPLRRLLLDSDALHSKEEALRRHRSQLSHPSDEPILPDYLLGPIRWPFEVFTAE